MAKVWRNKQFSNYLGENRAILDIYTNFISGATPTPSYTPTNTPTASFTPTPTPLGLFCVGQGFDFGPQTIEYYNGDYYVAGSFEFYQGNRAPLIVKIDANTGNIATDFYSSIPSTFGNTSAVVYDIELMSSGKLFAGGLYNLGGSYKGLNLLNADGSLDSSFNQADGPLNLEIRDIHINTGETVVYVVGNFTGTPNRIRAYDMTGAVWGSSNFGTGFNSAVFSIIGDASDNLFIGGGFTQYKGITRNRLVKTDQFGNIDATFMTGLGTGFNGPPTNMILDGGYLYCVGTFTVVNGVTKNRICRIDATTGVLDAAWAGTGITIPAGVFQRIAIEKNPITTDFVITITQTIPTNQANFNGTNFYGSVFSVDAGGNFVNTFGSPNDPNYGFNDFAQNTALSAEEIAVNSVNGDICFVGDFYSFNGQYFPSIVLTDLNGDLNSTSVCCPVRITSTPTPTPTLTPTNTPTPSPTQPLGLSFLVASGATSLEACNNLLTGTTFTIYAANIGNCGPCLPFNCWPCLDTTQQVFSNIAQTILIGDGYYANNTGSGNNWWLMQTGQPQPGGYGSC